MAREGENDVTKKEARKAALRIAAVRCRCHVTSDEIEAFLAEDTRKIQAALEKIADHLEWNAEGRPELD